MVEIVGFTVNNNKINSQTDLIIKNKIIIKKCVRTKFSKVNGESILYIKNNMCCRQTNTHIQTIK